MSRSEHASVDAKEAWVPADVGGAGDSELSIIKQPPAICQPKRKREEVRLCGQFVGNEQASFAQQRLALLQRLAHVACGVQHIGCKYNIVPTNGEALHMQCLSA